MFGKSAGVGEVASVKEDVGLWKWFAEGMISVIDRKRCRSVSIRDYADACVHSAGCHETQKGRDR